MASIGLPAFGHPIIPGARQTNPIALVGATVHPVSAPPIENATLLFDEGRIVAIGTDVALPNAAERIDVTGKHIYPSLISAFGNMGLIEISAVRATRDINESGQINANVRAEVAVNPDSELIPVTRSNGVLLALTVPGGGRISGTSALIQLDGWTWEDMTLKAPVGMHVQWPSMVFRASASDEARNQQRKDRDEALRNLHEAFDHARAYRKSREANQQDEGIQPIDLRWEAMQPVLDRKTPLIVSADEVSQIEAAVTFAQQQKVNLIIHGGYDAELCAPLLKRHNVPVIISGIYRLPRRRSDEYDAPYTLPERLHRAGLQYCIAPSGRSATSNARNLPYHAGTAAAYGLPRDEALKSITLYPAQILGVDDQTGSLEVGKDATLFVADGDPLQTPTQVQMAFIQGRRVDLSDRHKQLWKKYREKYRRLSPDFD